MAHLDPKPVISMSEARRLMSKDNPTPQPESSELAMKLFCAASSYSKPRLHEPYDGWARGGAFMVDGLGLAALSAERDALKAIVERLPETEDKKRVWPGMKLWHVHSEDGFAGPNSIVVVGYHDGWWYLANGGQTNFDMYSTEAAALAAQEAKAK